MKKALSFLLVALITISAYTFTPAIPSGAPEDGVALAAYKRWRSEVLKRRSGVTEPPHFSLAAGTQRIDARTARIEFVVAGQRSDFTLKLQPVKSQLMPDGQFKREPVGEATEIHRNVTASDKSPFPTLTIEFSVSIAADEAANAVEVRGVGDGSMVNLFKSLLLPLRDTPSASVVGTVFGTPKSTVSPFEKAAFSAAGQYPLPCPGYNPPTNTCDTPGAGECVNLTVVCDSGQVIGQCCLGGAADIDTANCTITCQVRRCTPRECQQP